MGYTLNENTFTGSPGASISANYSNTSRMGGLRFLDENLNPLDVTVTSLSGHDYTRPLSTGAVPEPAAWSLMLAGGMALLFRRRLGSKSQ